MSTAPSLVLLAPSAGLGGGIERVADAVAKAWPEHVDRIDMLDTSRPVATRGRKLVFGARSILAAVRRPRCAVLVIHAGLLPPAALVARLTPARVYLYGMGTEVWGPMSRPQRVGVQACHGLLAISSFTADRMASRSGVARRSVEVVYLPVDEELLALAGAPPVSAPAEIRFLTVSRLIPEHRYKGHQSVAAAFANVLREIPSARWTVVGDGSDRRGLEDRCRELGIRDAVDFRGAISDEDLAAEYRGATALVLPSASDPDAVPPVGEGFGLVYAEAGAFGVPSIAHENGGGALDYVRDGETGLTVDGQEALGAAMLLLARDPALRSRLGAAARDLTFERHAGHRFAAALRAALAG
ncbi:MAG: hypothetical protein QOG68_279 [Solirubrobacteraceae bacterium]|nr:hypothetical protein [Solirubrobacteraceae bacterium]